MNPHPSPFPTSPAAAALRGIGPIGAFGAWNGDEVEGPEEVTKASILSTVLATERAAARPRCPDCQSLLLLHEPGGLWCPSCFSGEIEGDGIEKTAIPAEADGVMREVTLHGPLDAHGLAALPVSEAVLKAHEQQLQRMDGPQPGMEVELTFNPTLNVYELLGSRSVMDALMAAGPKLKVTIHF